jgi:D-alanyl-D-alanine carboxypeptidase/D-alanyl-D-alanine-endopeptidase (penicillin-binding protein 4)
MWNHPDEAVSSAFYASLPIGGRSGTLEYRFRGNARAQGRVRAKTGTLSNASSLSGFVRAADGTPLAFSIMCNHHITDSDVVRAAQDVIVNALADRPPYDASP